MAQHAFIIQLPLWHTVGITYINRKRVDIHHRPKPNANCFVTRKLMLCARCTMVIHGNMTTHACLELVTSQHWRHNITVPSRSQRQHWPTKHWLPPAGVWRWGRRRHGRCSSGRSWRRTRRRGKWRKFCSKDIASDCEPALPRRSTRRRKPSYQYGFNVASIWMGVIVEIGVLLPRRLNLFIAERWLLPRQLGAVGVCISRRVLSEPSCCCRCCVFLTLLFVSADRNCDFMLIKA